jgi:oxygen-independent coproporphyrinogen-3 oxidase
VQQLIQAGGILDCPETPAEDVLLETLMLGLRLAEGLSLSTLSQQFGEKTLEQIWRALRPYQRQGWVEVLGADGKAVELQDAQTLPTNGQLRLSDPEGFLFSNTVLAALFSQLS